MLDPHFDTDADAPVKPHVEPSSQRVSNYSSVEPRGLRGLVRGQRACSWRGGKVLREEPRNGFIIAKASASLIWLNLPLTLVLLVFRPCPFKIHYAAG